jgi:signal transduction histidine kinase
MIGGTIALFLVPHPPEHMTQLAVTAWGFVSYKLLLFLVIWRRPGQLRRILLGTVVLDLGFVGLFVWLGGGLHSHFSLLFFLLIALAAAHFGPGLGLAVAAGAGFFYALGSLAELPGEGWHHLAGRVATFFLLGGSLGYLSRREREAREETERLNRELTENQGKLEGAYRELQAAQRRLVQAERLATIGQMSAKVSHEIRNPLSSISLNTELLEDEIQELPAGQRDGIAGLLKSIRTQIDVLSGVTEAYLRFARLPKPRPEPTALGELIGELVEFVRPELGMKGVGVRSAIPGELPKLSVDPGQIRQLLLNLLRNAADAMPDGGAVTVEAGVEEKERYVEVTVSDAGVGIPEGDRDRIFEPFYTTKSGGTGLGLAIARQIAEDHGGTLTCEGGSAGGSRFRLRFPVPVGG